MSEGQLVKCCVVKLGDNGRRIDLSLRTSRGGCEGALLHHAQKKVSFQWFLSSSSNIVEKLLSMGPVGLSYHSFEPCAL